MSVRCIANLVLIYGSLSLIASSASGDGGTVRFRQDVGVYKATLFTETAVLRAGTADMSVLIEDQGTGRFVTDVDVTIVITPTDQSHRPRHYSVTSSQATNQLFQSTRVNFPAAGVWRVDLRVAHATGEEYGTFHLTVGDSRPRWVHMIPWIALPFVVIVMFGLHETLVSRSS